jgi:hypothetical protein
MTRKKPSPLLSSGEVAQNDRLAKLMARCGIEVLPPCHTLRVPIERITVPDQELARPSATFLRSIRTYGIRQPPSVAFCSGTAYDAPDAKYTVVMGSRRVESGRILFFKEHDPRFKVIKCEVYEWNVPGLNDVLALMENSLRSDAWVRDIIHLRRLVERKIALTLDDLADFGFQRNTISKKLTIALLPAVLLDPICAGELSLDAAMQIIRLKDGARSQLVTLVQGGKALTADLVRQVYRGQVDQGQAAVQAVLLQMWQQSGPGAESAGNGHGGSPPSAWPAWGGVSPATGGAPSPAELLVMLQRFEACVQRDQALAHLDALTRVYISELQAVLRTASVRDEVKEEALHG